MNEKLKPAVQPKKKEQESRVPWLFDLEVKDLTSPITIRRIRLLQIGGLLAVIGSAKCAKKLIDEISVILFFFWFQPLVYGI